MDHQLQLQNKKYRQWVKAGLGLGYLKDGLAPFCTDIAREQHKDILDRIRRAKSLPSTVTCGTCIVDTLQPDHQYVGDAKNKICPLGQVKCNCCFTRGKIACPNNICGAIYDNIIQSHASTPPAPNWKNTNSQLWSVEPWSVCKCFINAPGYEQTVSATDVDSTGLLHLIINNMYFHSHIGCNLTAPNNLFLKVRQYRNDIFHSSNMELEEAEANTFICDMINILQDGKDLIHRTDAKNAVLKLQELKKKDFVITTEGFEEVLKQIKEEMAKVLKSTENVASKDEYEDLKKKLTELDTQMSKEKDRKVEAEKEHAELKKKLTELETQMSKEKEGKIEAEKEHAELKKKLAEFETHMSREKEQKLEAEQKHEKLQKKLTELETQMSKEKKGKLEAEKKHEKLQKKQTELDTQMSKEKDRKIEAEKEHEELKKKLTEFETQMSKEKEGKIEADKEYAELKKKLTELETKMSKEKEGKLEAEQKHEKLQEKLTELETQMSKEKVGKIEAEQKYEKLQKKLNELEIQMSQEKEKKIEAEKEHDDMKRMYSVLEKEITKIRTETSTGISQEDYEQAKLEWRKKMIADYLKKVLKVPAMPLRPRGEKCSFSEIYVRPTITRVTKGEKGETVEVEVNSMSEIFTKDGVPQKSIYVVGDAGYGKSSFCRYLVSCWCAAHSEGHSLEDDFNSIAEMKKFEFMFLISLRHNQDLDSVHDMIKNQYDNEVLSKVLDKDSAKIIVLLDGLDEWSSKRKNYNQFQTMGLPKQDNYKDYTIVTTSRPWKIHTLGVSDSEIEQLLNLKGFDMRCEKSMVCKTVLQLNTCRHASKDATVCERKLTEKSLATLKQVPIMLQQLICLWFDGKLDKTSRCAIFTGMLELFFTWSDMKTTESTDKMVGCQKIELPQHLRDKDKLRLNKHLIYEVSKLAYEALFNCPKDKSLTFDISFFDKLEISDEVRESCLKLGILTEDECPSLSVSEPPSSLFSFIHKSMQEYLAAVNIAINFLTKMSSSDSTENVELERNCVLFVNEVFKNCSTVNDILEQSNVVIMLCGLELNLATHVSKYIFDIVSEDSHVQKYRRTSRLDRTHSMFSQLVFPNVPMFITDIQKLTFDLIEECNASCLMERFPVFYIGDLVITNRNQYLDIVCSSIDKQLIVADSVRSIFVDHFNTSNVKFAKYLPMFHHLEKIVIIFNYKKIIGLLRLDLSSTTSNIQMTDEINNSIIETIKVNTSSLKSLTLINHGFDDLSSFLTTVVRYLPSMINLVTLCIGNFTMSHDDTIQFCNFLEETSHLEQLQLRDVTCKCWNEHNVNLLKHHQLEELYLNNTFNVTDVDTTNLEIFYFYVVENSNIEKIFDIIMKSNKLKEIVLYGKLYSHSHSFHKNLTRRLITVLPLLHNLNKLELCWCRLKDNIIQSPVEMKSLKHIKFFEVRMSLTTWQKIVDSFPNIPHTVKVEVNFCYITEDGKEDNDDRSMWSLSRLIADKNEEAIQYVKDKGQLFHVEYYSHFNFNFSTKK